MDCKQEFTVIQIQRLLRPVKMKIIGLYIILDTRILKFCSIADVPAKYLNSKAVALKILSRIF